MALRLLDEETRRRLEDLTASAGLPRPDRFQSVSGELGLTPPSDNRILGAIRAETPETPSGSIPERLKSILNMITSVPGGVAKNVVVPLLSGALELTGLPTYGRAVGRATEAGKEREFERQAILEGLKSGLTAVPSRQKAAAALEISRLQSELSGLPTEQRIKRLREVAVSPETSPGLAEFTTTALQAIQKPAGSMYESLQAEAAEKGLTGAEANSYVISRLAGKVGAETEARQEVLSRGLDLTPEAMQVAAEQVLAGTPIAQAVPGWGTAGSRQRAQVYNMIAGILKQEGQTGAALTAKQAGLQANRTALAWNKRQTAGILGFENTVKKQFDLIEKQAAKVPRTGIPLYNEYQQWLSTRIAGDPDIQGLFNLVATTTAEYAKVMTGNIGASASTDAARAEAKRLLDAAFTPEQLKVSMDLMRQEMENRRAGLLEESDRIQEELATGLTKKPGPRLAPGGERPPLSSFEKPY